MTVHLHRATPQSATRYCVRLDEHTLWCCNPKRRPLPTVCCRKRRVAGNLYVQVYYDGHYFSCKPGTGCRTRRST